MKKKSITTIILLALAVILLLIPTLIIAELNNPGAWIAIGIGLMLELCIFALIASEDIKIASLVIIVINILLIFPAKFIANNMKETTYCGKVINKYITPAGYKVYPEWRIVFYNDSLKRNIDINVGKNCYSNLEIGENTCFELNKNQIVE